MITVPNANGENGFTATQTYSYDSLNRLKSAVEKIGGNVNWQQEFDYDIYGNRNFDEANTTTLPKHCVENALPAVCDSDRKALNPTINLSDNKFADQQGYEYDENGNVTKDSNGRQFTYDALNKQVQVKNVNSQVIGDYFYDGESKRVKKTGNNENIVFVYDAFGSLIEEFTIDDPQPQLPTETQTTYLTTDTLGSPRVVTDENGNVVSRRDFLPFGEEILANENNRKVALGYISGDSLRQKFTGYEKDTETDLEFAQNRYYNNKLGRFTTPDPLMASARALDPQSFNRFAYVKNNPLNLVDPNGLMDCNPKKENCRVKRGKIAEVTVTDEELPSVIDPGSSRVSTLAPPTKKNGEGCGILNFICKPVIDIWDKFTGGDGTPTVPPVGSEGAAPAPAPDPNWDPNPGDGNAPDPGGGTKPGLPDGIDPGGVPKETIALWLLAYTVEQVKQKIKEWHEQWTKVGWWTSREQYEKMMSGDRTIPKDPLAGAAWYSIEGPNDYKGAAIGSVYFEFEVQRKDLIIPAGKDTWAMSVHLPGANMRNMAKIKLQGGEFSPKYRNPTGILYVKRRHGETY